MKQRVFQIRVEPSHDEFNAEPGEILMAAAQRSGLRWPNLCGGFAECGVCNTYILHGPPRLPEPSPTELALTKYVRLLPGSVAVRLACQLVVTGDLVVRKPGARRQSAEAPPTA